MLLPVCDPSLWTFKDHTILLSLWITITALLCYCFNCKDCHVNSNLCNDSLRSANQMHKITLISPAGTVLYRSVQPSSLCRQCSSSSVATTSPRPWSYDPLSHSPVDCPRGKDSAPCRNDRQVSARPTDCLYECSTTTQNTPASNDHWH